MPNALQPKGDGEWPYSAPYTGLNSALPSILLPPTAQDVQTSPSFAIVRGSIAAPWPFSFSLFGSQLAEGEYFLFATASGYVVTNLFIYQIQGSATPATAWGLAKVGTMPDGAFGSTWNNLSVPFIETNGCLFFSCNLGIYFYSPLNTPTIQPWAINFTANFLTIFSQRMVLVGTNATTETTTPATPEASAGSGGSLPAATYYFKVTAIFGQGTESSPSGEASAATTGSSGSVSLTWTAVSNAVSYNVYVGTATDEENAVFSTSTNSFDLTAYTAGTVSPPTVAPLSPWTIAWSAVSTFSNTSVGSFNANTNTDAGVVGGWDVLTNYSQGIPTGIVNLGYSIYVQMTQGIVNVNPAQSSIDSPYTFYNYWQESVPCGSLPGTVAQYGPISAFVTPDNVDIWIPGSQTPIGIPIMPYLRKLLLNVTLQEIQGNAWPLLQNPPCNATFVTVYNELHYVLTFNVYGVPPQQATPPYPNAATTPQWFGLILDYNFASQSWAQQVTPPLIGELYQIIGPPLTTTAYSAIPQQSFLIAATAASPTSTPGWVVFAPDVFNQTVWAAAQCQGLESQPQPCQVGFPQTPIAAGHRPAIRRVRIEYSWDEMTLATQGVPVDLTVTMQGTITQNTGTPNGNGVATTTIQSISKTISVNPPGIVSGATTIQPCLTATAYADMVLSLENPQISLSWTDPSAHQRLLIHRVTGMVNDTKGTMQ